jgi:rhodanese-related sulfurtransferase
MKKLILLFCILITKPSISQTDATSTIVKNVSAEDFKKAIDAKKGILIDLRTDDELKSKGKIKGAMQIDFLSKEAELIISKLDKSKTYLIYCAGGGRSGQCAELMTKTGFKDVIHMYKGFDEWKKKGFEIEKQ